MRPGKWSLAQQARVCQLLADQLQSGFSLQQALTFMRTTDSRLPAELQQIEAQLVAGVGLVVGLKPYLQENIYFQLRLTSHYGDLGPALARSATLLTLMATQRQRLRQLLDYPVGLLGGMGLLFATLQYGVMPQLQTSLAPTTTGPRLTWPAYVAIVAIIGFGITGVAVARWWWHQPTLSRVRGYLRWPLVGRIFQAYYGYYLTENLSQLVQSGLSVKQMIQTLQRLPERALLHQLAVVLAQLLDQGTSPMGWLSRQPYIPSQLVVLLQQGNTPEQLARELTAYSRLQYQRLVQRSERGLAWVQPILFTLVAGLIVMAYLRLLLPLYHNLQGVY
ncbi:type II secretion system F family protein [Levilactobacillus suantsaii]|uniref:Type II secretory pathway/competence component n=1 Tax=Levilactobacillus suantsaii TaxID=2292255 RepID=A0A4Q0VJJ2_9LACO|nr:type II secretion system F family protein [Levilactobacillus suantsaii]QMU07875.1 type II secretion system F family protein [Levilactobacillus suantsaii]RXI79756.1 Type II secretory pathway/competence component [Levilactobacillus suantsaii]